jgi:hypothetical protein
VVRAGVLSSAPIVYTTNDYITLPLDTSIVKRIFIEDKIEVSVGSIHLTTYKTKRSTSATEKIYDGVSCDADDNYV